MTKKYTLADCVENQRKVDASIKHNGEYNPSAAAKAEIVEMQEHMGLIKTWGHSPINKKQAYLELVDVFAFTMSAAEKLEISHIEVYLCSLDTLRDVNLLTISLDLDNEIYNYNFYMAMRYIASINEYHFDKTSQDLFRMYFAKSELTRFRQNNGYKSGGYNKVWSGRQDNEWLYDLVDSGVEIDDLQDRLGECYRAAMSIE